MSYIITADVPMKRCGICAHWAHKKRRNCSNPETPLYYAECLFPLNNLEIPHCVSFEETSENNGTGCPCFSPLASNQAPETPAGT